LIRWVASQPVWLIFCPSVIRRVSCFHTISEASTASRVAALVLTVSRLTRLQHQVARNVCSLLWDAHERSGESSANHPTCIYAGWAAPRVCVGAGCRMHVPFADVASRRTQPLREELAELFMVEQS
jgi:hypothetical protein